MNQQLHEFKAGDETLAFYREALDFLNQGKAPFLVGGAYALAHYTGIIRDTKDLDVFVRPRDAETVLETFAAAGYHTDRTFPHWLGKVYQGEHILDVIYSSGNGIVDVDDLWFAHAVPGTVLGRRVLLCPPEEMIWSKGFIMERERFDGADINHLIRACWRSLDWDRLFRRFGPHGRLLLAHLILFGYVYPAETAKVPAELMQELLDRLRREGEADGTGEPVCRGTLLSRAQYLIDIEQWGYRDARVRPYGKMSANNVAIWTEAIGNDNPALDK
jgi:hypothetical protein